MSVLQIVVPVVTIEEMQAIWNAQPDSTLSLFDGRRLLDTQPMHLARLPLKVGDIVTSREVLFRCDYTAGVDRWRAELFGGKERIGGRCKYTINVIPGDSIACSVAIEGGDP